MGLNLTTAAGDRLSTRVRYADIKQGDTGRCQTVTSQNEERWNVELADETQRNIGTIRAGAGQPPLGPVDRAQSRIGQRRRRIAPRIARKFSP